MIKKPSTLKLDRVDFNNRANKRAFNRALFDEVAPTYDRLTPWLSFGRDAAWKKMLVRSLPDLQRPVILDLACGTGDITRALAARYPAGKVTGLDLNPVMLSLAKTRTSHPRIQFRRGDMNHTGFKAGQFDLVTGGYALRNAPDLRETLAEIHRVLKKGGRGAFLDFSKSPSGWVQRLSLGLLRIWGGWWGWLLHGNPDVYAYLAESLSHFPDRRELRQYLAEAGFSRVRSRVLFFGFTELVFFEK